MKVCLFAFPRTSSTALVHRVARSLAVPVFEEPLTHIPKFIDRYNFVHTTINAAPAGAFKFMNHNFFELSWQSVNWKSFDKIICIERRDVAMACMSTYVAQTNNVWQYSPKRPHPPVKGGAVPKQFVDSFVNGIKLYYDIKSKVCELTEPITVFYEDSVFYSEQVAEYIGVSELLPNNFIEPSGLDYHSLCPNYQQVIEWVNAHVINNCME